MPLHVAFEDLTKALDYVHREEIFTVFKKVDVQNKEVLCVNN